MALDVVRRPIWTRGPGPLRAWATIAMCPWALAHGGEWSPPVHEPSAAPVAVHSVVEPPPQEAPQVIDIRTIGHNSGSMDAPIRVVEFSDFGCDQCQRFHEETYPTLREEFIDSGRVRWKYVPFVVGTFPHGEEAGLAGECAGEQGRFSEMRDRLFENQAEWKGSDDAMPHLVRYGSELGLDIDAFQDCIEAELPQTRLSTALRAARALGVRGTPTFFINGRQVQGALPIQFFRDLFEAELRRPDRSELATGS